MKIVMADRRLILGYLVAHILLFFTFKDQNVFWYIFTAAMLILISYSILNEEFGDEASTFAFFSFGILSGLALYMVFSAAHLSITELNLPFGKQVASLYRDFSPNLAWHFIVLIFIIAPGEEIFWRGFIQRRLLRITNVKKSIVISTVLYASVHFYSGELILVLAALAAGLAWSSLYAWKRSIPLVVISHIVFDLLLFVFLPLNS